MGAANDTVEDALEEERFDEAAEEFLEDERLDEAEGEDLDDIPEEDGLKELADEEDPVFTEDAVVREEYAFEPANDESELSGVLQPNKVDTLKRTTAKNNPLIFKKSRSSLKWYFYF